MGSPSRLGRPSGADGERTRRRIMTATMEYVAEAGYAHASMKGIAEAAGVTSAAIYHYFQSKQELVLAILTSVVGDIMGRLENAALIEAPLPQRFVALLDEAADCVRDYPAATRFEANLYVESAQHPEFQPALAGRREAEEKLYARMVDHAVARGELPPGTDRQSVVDMFTSITWGLTYLSATVPADRHRAAIKAMESLLVGTAFSRTRPDHSTR